MNPIKSFQTLFLSLFLLILASSEISAQTGTPKAYENGLVVSATQQASEAGVEMLKRGGNAVDAAVATHFALAVTYPAAGNIGGGGFMVLHLRNGEQQTLDFREVAPTSTDKKDYVDSNGEPNDNTVKGPLSIGVPGSVHGMLKALQQYGTMPVDLVLEPAIKLAREGFHLSYEEARRLNRTRDTFLEYESTSKYFVKSDSTDYSEGELFVQKDLARTLERIAQFGIPGFYNGITADLIERQMQQLNGNVTREDLSGYKSVWRKPVSFKYHDFDIISMPPPSSGGIALAQMLNMIEPYPVDSYDWNGKDYLHLLTEAQKRAYADRAYFLGDPDHVSQPTPLLINKSYAKKRMNNFKWDKATPADEISHGDVPYFEESLETTHFSVIDNQGNAVSVTTTLNSGYGSKIVVDGAGFFLNNEMDDFSVQPGVPNQFGLIGGKANEIAPNKRMVSSMTPTIVLKDRKPYLILGTPGGSTIITTVLQVFLNVTEFDMNIQQAVSAPRVHHQWRPEEIYVDPYAVSPTVKRELMQLGHIFAERGYYVGRADCIQIKDGMFYGGADPRGSDYAAGY
jgi:gamma-glutamyltranspeptidase/glutathione hydrolase